MPKESADQYTKAEIADRMERALRRSLQMKPAPHNSKAPKRGKRATSKKRVPSA